MKIFKARTIQFTITYSLIVLGCNMDEKNIQNDFTTTFENSKGAKTATYRETIQFYKNLSDKFTSVSLYEFDKTDSGEPIHLVTYNPYRKLESEFSENRSRNVLLINNGIHPGESDGIDASMLLIRDLAEGKIKQPKNTTITVIPVYNIGGALNRNNTSRTNQNGPESYGFRGNARNYDLNRDFIKADTKNARAFAKLFSMLQPDLFIDNHVSNGADYQYTLTHLFTQHNKLGGALGDYLKNTFTKKLEDSLQQKNWDITPYVNVFNRTPESGFSQFMDSPRYSTGYTTLFNTFGMMVETHMLKPYKQRVEGTYELMKSFIEIADNDAALIKELRKKSLTNYQVGNYYPLQWAIDSSNTTTLEFKGFEGSMIPSVITNADRLKYDSSKPFTREVTYYNYFKSTDSIKIPSKYIIPQGYWNIIELLELNGISYKKIPKDTSVVAQVYHINEFQTTKNPYEGHYLHYGTTINKTSETVVVKKGDFIIDTQQKGVRYLLETLEPSAPDSFFNWNFFDTILQQKEGFSPYVWEDKAVHFLNENPEMKKVFEAKKQNETEFNNNWYLQLDWIHKQSPHYEKSHLRYPIIRVGG